jgi:hypothetical protein
MPIDLEKIKQGEYIPQADFFRVFDAQWDRLHERFRKYESLQYYDEGPDGPFISFSKGDIHRFLARLLDLRMDDKPFYESAKARGTSFTRVHSIRLPLSDYLKCEFNSYHFSKKMGEDITVIEEANVLANVGILPPDFMVFDQGCAMFQDYEDGQLKGAWITTNAELIKQAIDVFNALHKKATPFEHYYTVLPQVVQLAGGIDGVS